MLKIKGKDYYTVKDLINDLGVHKNTIYHWMRKGDLIPFGKRGREHIFTPAEIKRSSKTSCFYKEE